MHYFTLLLRSCFYQISCIGVLVCFFLLVACNDKNKPSKGVDDVSNRKYYRINLFTEDKIEEDNTADRKLSFQEASDLSECVLHVSSVQKIDSVVGRGVKLFYLYKVNTGRVIKSSTKKDTKEPLYFISKERLFTGRAYKDSVYLFLAPLADFHILKAQTGIKYHWVDQAPFSSNM